MFFNKFKIIILCGFFCTTYATFHMQSISYDGVPAALKELISMEPFVKIGEKYYLIEAEHKLNWYGAAHFCRTKGANLASIDSLEEQNAISEYLRSKGHKGWFWLSANDLEAEGKFKWMGTGQPITLNMWTRGQPDNAHGKEHCGHLWLQGDKFEMNDWQCAIPTFYICEINMPKTVAFTLW